MSIFQLSKFLFHLFWKIYRHEHLYGGIESYIIRSDKFYEAAKSSRFRDVSVILCTLSMLSNNLLSKITSFNPFVTMIVDEASQIEIGNYMPIFSKFKTTLRKVCFIGDDKQCKFSKPNN